jgi:hypothetical protein
MLAVFIGASCMAKLTFNANPTFSINVNVAVDGGTKDEILITYRHRTRKDKEQFAREVAERYAALGDKQDTDAVADLTADVLMEMISAWAFEEPLTKENLKHVCNEHGAAANAFAEAYWNSTEPARVKN